MVLDVVTTQELGADNERFLLYVFLFPFYFPFIIFSMAFPNCMNLRGFVGTTVGTVQ